MGVWQETGLLAELQGAMATGGLGAGFQEGLLALENALYMLSVLRGSVGGAEWVGSAGEWAEQVLGHRERAGRRRAALFLAVLAPQVAHVLDESGDSYPLLAAMGQ